MAIPTEPIGSIPRTQARSVVRKVSGESIQEYSHLLATLHNQ